jgi:mono/diheme cytochrome c family protein
MFARLASFALFILAATMAQAQQTHLPQLNPEQTEGRAIFSKSCTICHLPLQYEAPTFGPRLNQASLDVNQDVLRGVISTGMPHRPGFKHMYTQAQIDSIIAYLKTVPAPAPAAATQTR